MGKHMLFSVIKTVKVHMIILCLKAATFVEHNSHIDDNCRDIVLDIFFFSQD